MIQYTPDQRKKYAQIWARRWCKFHNYADDRSSKDFEFVHFAHDVRDWSSPVRICDVLTGKEDYIVRLGELANVR